MKKGEVYEGEVLRTEYPGRGIVLEGKHEVRVKDALPGQTVRFRVTKKNSHRCEGMLLDVMKRAENEIASDCPHFGRCGGCSYRTLSYQDQLKLKEDQLIRLFEPVVKQEAPGSGADGQTDAAAVSCQKGGRPVWFQGVKASPDFPAYRNKMEFSFGDLEKGGELQLGLHVKGSFYDILTTDDCRIVDPDFHLILKCVLEWARETRLPHFHRVTHQGYFRHLLVRRAANTGEILVDLVTTSQAEADLNRLTDRLRALPVEGKIAGILHTVNDSVADAINDGGTEVLYGSAVITENLLGLNFRITPFSFFQTNSRGAEVLYETVRSYIGDTTGKTVFDLYSGTGTIAQVLAPAASHVTGVEIVPEAVESARESARLNGLDNCDFICGDVLKVVDELPEKPDLIVLDPPREGINPKAMPKIIAFGVRRIVYISCKATSLARDLQPLQMAGYRVEKMCGVDLFPGTEHIETVCLLSKLSETKNHISVKVDMDEMDVTAAESEDSRSRRCSVFPSSSGSLKVSGGRSLSGSWW